MVYRKKGMGRLSAPATCTPSREQSEWKMILEAIVIGMAQSR
jgi:hypothetical protein